MRPALAILALLLWAALPILRAEDFQGASYKLPYEEGAISYSAGTPEDRVARLQQLLKAGKADLPWDGKFGYLPAVLDRLQVPKSSQMLVFSKTSQQRRHISPHNPRAIFFSDDIYIGYTPGAPLIEISAVDPKLGGVFYTLEQEQSAQPAFVRSEDCLQCHGGPRTLGVPGHFVRSVQTDDLGEIEPGTDAPDITQCAPMADRWGGWYVTGQHGAQPHRGNLVGAGDFARFATEPGFRQNLPDLKKLVDTSRYLSPQSDIVALMVLEHQTHMENYITRLNYETRSMMATYGHIRYLKHQVNAFLRYLLFTEEAPLASPVTGAPNFAASFTASGPRDSQGRSLRDLDLHTRLFKHPCSYLIYSEAFDAIPTPMREHLLQRLFDILTGTDEDPQFAKLAPAERRSILEILRETKPNLPDYWREPAAPVTVAAVFEGGN